MFNDVQILDSTLMSHPSRQLIYGSIAFLCILVAAVIGYVIIDHSSVLDAFYMVVLTIFGEINLKDISKIGKKVDIDGLENLEKVKDKKN